MRGRDAPVHRPHLGCRAHALPHRASSGIGNTRSAGRVQTPTLALVVEREKERDAFIPEDYWVITGNAAPKGDHDEAFTATHATARFKDKDEADAVMARIAGANEATVGTIEKKRRKSNPPAPFNTTSLMAAQVPSASSRRAPCASPSRST